MFDAVAANHKGQSGFPRRCDAPKRRPGSQRAPIFEQENGQPAAVAPQHAEHSRLGRRIERRRALMEFLRLECAPIGMQCAERAGGRKTGVHPSAIFRASARTGPHTRTPSVWDLTILCVCRFGVKICLTELSAFTKNPACQTYPRAGLDWTRPWLIDGPLPVSIFLFLLKGLQGLTHPLEGRCWTRRATHFSAKFSLGREWSWGKPG